MENGVDAPVAPIVIARQGPEWQSTRARWRVPAEYLQLAVNNTQFVINAQFTLVDRAGISHHPVTTSTPFRLVVQRNGLCTPLQLGVVNSIPLLASAGFSSCRFIRMGNQTLHNVSALLDVGAAFPVQLSVSRWLEAGSVDSAVTLQPSNATGGVPQMRDIALANEAAVTYFLYITMTALPGSPSGDSTVLLSLQSGPAAPSLLNIQSSDRVVCSLSRNQAAQYDLKVTWHPVFFAGAATAQYTVQLEPTAVPSAGLTGNRLGAPVPTAPVLTLSGDIAYTPASVGVNSLATFTVNTTALQSACSLAGLVTVLGVSYTIRVSTTLSASSELHALAPIQAPAVLTGVSYPTVLVGPLQISSPAPGMYISV